MRLEIGMEVQSSSPPRRLIRPQSPPYVRTLVAQILLFAAVIAAINLGPNTQQFNLRRRQRRLPYSTNSAGVAGDRDFYFLSVTGGFRTPSQQSLLLKQMERVVKTYNAKFVVNIGELGLRDPLLQNATRNFDSLRVPWYATKASEATFDGCSLKKIKLPFHRALDLIVLSTDLLQDPLRTITDSQSRCRRRMLEAKDSTWRFVIGLHPLEGCERSKEPDDVKKIHKTLHHSFMKYEVDAYLYGQRCMNSTDSYEYDLRGGVAYISHPGPFGSPWVAGDGFLVHRVTFLEIETYFVTSSGKVSRRVVLHQRGAQAQAL